MRHRALIPLVLVATFVLGAAACSDDDDTASDTPTPTPTAEPTAEPTPTTEPTPTPTATGEPTAEPTPTSTPTPTAEPTTEPTASEETDVLVYFLDGERLVVGGRTSQDLGVAAAAMEGLLAGPQGIETELGWTSQIPAGTTLNGIDIADGTATVDLSAEFESGGGSASVIARVAQVVFTLTQFPTVDEVDIRIDGVPDDAIAGEGFQGQDLTRDMFLTPDFAGAPAPLILVESPYTGEAVEPPLVIRGLSNTFEANVLYEVTDTDGLIIAEGFTTATAGTGTWGTFEIVIDAAELDFGREGVASVIVFEQSARDGSRINLVEVPIVVGAAWF